MLDRLILHNDRIPLTPTSLTRFHSRAPPSITISSYLLRISRYTNVEPCCLLILLSYVDKVCARLSDFTISSLTVHRFVIAGVSVGSKALSDAFCTNGRYARVGGVSLTEMCLLEKEFCEAIDWRLTVSGLRSPDIADGLRRRPVLCSLTITPPSCAPTPRTALLALSSLRLPQYCLHSRPPSAATRRWSQLIWSERRAALTTRRCQTSPPPPRPSPPCSRQPRRSSPRR